MSGLQRVVPGQSQGDQGYFWDLTERRFDQYLVKKKSRNAYLRRHAMAEKSFNPFTKRISRDLRNDLSEAFSTAVETGDSTQLEKTVAAFSSSSLDHEHRHYLEERQRRYQQALMAIGRNVVDPIDRAVILWDLELFFEVHEVLEHQWYTATGEMREVLQALIRAAGVYIKREFDFVASAERIAAKAVPVLAANRQLLTKHFDPGILIHALTTSAPPPKLG
jgi:hypothetical protein